MKPRISTLFLTALLPFLGANALRLEPIKYADFSNWVVRDISESKIIGGKQKTVYEIAPNDHIVGNKPYINAGGSLGPPAMSMLKYQGW